MPCGQSVDTSAGWAKKYRKLLSISSPNIDRLSIFSPVHSVKNCNKVVITRKLFQKISFCVRRLFIVIFENLYFKR